MQQRQLVRGILVAVALLIVMIGGSLVWLFTQSPVSLLVAHPPLPEMVRLVPRSATSMVVLTAPLSKLEAFWLACLPAAQRRRGRYAWEQVFSQRGPAAWGELLQAANIDFREEIQPWLGSDTLLAWIPPNPQTTPQPLLILSTQWAEGSQRFLNLLWQRQWLAGIPVNVEAYKGVQIVSTPLTPGKTLAAAAFGNRYVLLSNHAQVLRQAVDSWQLPSQSLATSPSYQAVMASLPQAHLGWGYVRAPQVADPLQAMGFGLGVTFQGLVAETNLLWHLPSPKAQSLANSHRQSPSLLGSLPPDTTLLVGGTQFASTADLWQSLATWLGLDLTTPLADLASQIQLEGAENLWAGIPGDYALAQIRDPALPPTWILAAAGVDQFPPTLSQQLASHGWQTMPIPFQPSAEAFAWIPVPSAPEVLPGLPTDLPMLPPSLSEVHAYQPIAQGIPEQLESETEAEWLREVSTALLPSTPAIAYHRLQNHRLWLSNSLAGLENTLQAPSLDRDKQWKQATLPLPRRSQGYLYLDASDAGIPAAWQPWIRPFQTFAFSQQDSQLLPDPASWQPQQRSALLLQKGQAFLAFRG
ncbi:MAG: DUF3352 domain-containing protein [Cyanobacteriota bacterium]|nr:DUF3352 domain-containing protein [Cyanobacteriota bacterium]